MFVRNRFVAATAAVALTAGLVGVGAGAASAAPTATADREKRGDCGPNARYDADLERDDGGLETSFEIDSTRAAGEEWRITMSHNGKRILNEVRRTDNEGEIDVERTFRDAPGRDTVRMTAKRVGGGGSCNVTLTL